MHEFAIGAAGEDLTIALGELRIQVGEALDLGRADEREILRVEEHAQPFAAIGVVADREERLVQALDGHGGLQVELGKLVSNTKHLLLLVSLSFWGVGGWLWLQARAQRITHDSQPLLERKNIVAIQSFK